MAVTAVAVAPVIPTPASTGAANGAATTIAATVATARTTGFERIFFVALRTGLTTAFTAPTIGFTTAPTAFATPFTAPVTAFVTLLKAFFQYSGSPVTGLIVPEPPMRLSMAASWGLMCARIVSPLRPWA